ncbi:ABC-2 type transport system permease protein [Tamaricihabitans halophyticus]|uniref:ABC-2 type transport system permease protein n=1 Tax=Tamaricihabitans halophyticus TaxID=1262583 RepID=A0A4R2QXT8_9PSEU|nr:ABC transporter permease [Tamaricihabitans halophyticus]TCP54973.1 ABC-2 type transport system permease protein [Tamaricihabitans halophyticus]
MNHTLYAARLGVSRGLHEFRQGVASSDQWFNVIMALIFLTVLIFQRDATVDGTSFSLASVTLPSMLGMMVALGGLVGVSSQLSTSKEDGSLLRAKTVPGGMVGFLVARIVQVILDTLLSLLVILIPGVFLVNELVNAGITGWLTMLWIFALGLLATLPWGAIISSLTKTMQSTFGFTMLPVMGLTAISGIFYPISAIPDWLQVIAQVFPIYWIGIGMRSALLPDSAMAAEIGESWRQLETIGVLGAWAILGLLLAPTILRRAARRESGSALERRQNLTMQRATSG